ncbi:YdcF family protein [uncultured Desulfobacter sp.]|uniref:YdcF family protein n=1 Tax=uncultured Desulfobacter sp. TaxID=240139 RepID=UPI002AAB0BEB|nr:YdcF family protein [uncultured Desulfobacter sp.]
MGESLFFWVSKLTWTIIRPDFLLVIFAVMGMLLWFSGAVQKAKILLTCVVLAMIIITVIPLGTMLLVPLEHRFPTNPALPEKVDGIIMLGGAENNLLTQMWHQPETKNSADRYIGFARLIRAYPDAIHLFTGGSGNSMHQDWKDANTARQVFLGLDILGLDISKMVFEDKSRNTYENGLFSKALVHPEPGQIWVLLTTAAHIPRSVGVFSQLNWPVIPYPVDHFTRPDKRIYPGLNFSGNLERLVVATTEWAGLTAYYITGKTNALFPSVSSNRQRAFSKKITLFK